MGAAWASRWGGDSTAAVGARERSDSLRPRRSVARHPLGWKRSSRPDEIKGDEPTALADDDLNWLRRAWTAWTAATPEPLVDLTADLGLTPYLRSLRELFHFYPSPTTGLDIWEQRFLDQVPRHTGTARVIGQVLGWKPKSEYCFVSDSVLFRRLLELSRDDLPSPLLRSSGARKAMRDTTFELTDFGRAVLRGEANHVDVNGIDRWVGGVHFSSTEDRVWWFDDDGVIRR